MNKLKAVAFAAILIGVAVAGQAQQTTQGATPVAKDELRTLVKGATLRWMTSSGGETQLKLADDGSFAGHVRNASARGKGMDLSGTWLVTDDGKLCRTQVARGQTDKYCWTVSRSGNKYFYSVGTGPATELDISK